MCHLLVKGRNRRQYPISHNPPSLASQMILVVQSGATGWYKFSQNPMLPSVQCVAHGSYRRLPVHYRTASLLPKIYHPTSAFCSQGSASWLTQLFSATAQGKCLFPRSRREWPLSYIPPSSSCPCPTALGGAHSHSRKLVDSIREAVFTVSPKRQYRGILCPTTPATQGPARDGRIRGRAETAWC